MPGKVFSRILPGLRAVNANGLRLLGEEQAEEIFEVNLCGREISGQRQDAGMKHAVTIAAQRDATPGLAE